VAAARIRMCLIIISIWFVVRVAGSFFFPLKSGQRGSSQSLSTNDSILWQSSEGYEPHLDKPKAEACSKFLFFTPLASLWWNTSKQMKFRKKLCVLVSTHRKLHSSGAEESIAGHYSSSRASNRCFAFSRSDELPSLNSPGQSARGSPWIVV
jgi:hypothetical protein